MRRGSLVLVFLLAAAVLGGVVGCDGAAVPADAPADGPADGPLADASIDAPVDAGPASCQDLITEWRQIVADLPRGCVDVSDCLLVGTSREGCDCGPALAVDCGGEPVNGAAYLASGAPELAAQFQTAVCTCEHPMECICDCSPHALACEAGLCVARVPDCGCLSPAPC